MFRAGLGCERHQSLVLRRGLGRIESLWVTFLAACGVSPVHDQRLRQEAGTGLPEATREPPVCSLLKYPAASGGDPLSRVARSPLRPSRSTWPCQLKNSSVVSR